MGCVLVFSFPLFFAWLIDEAITLMIRDNVEYDDFWVEADATRRGKEIQEKFFKE